MIGLTLQFIKKFPMPDIIIGFFILSLCAIVSVLSAMLTNRYKNHGVHDDINHMSTYEDNEWTKSQAILNMLFVLQEAIKDNRTVIVNRAKFMYIATWFTFSSLIFLIISFTLKQINL